jgi:tRNA uridine 5-carboxymethylaminomethyl modification enzyme
MHWTYPTFYDVIVVGAGHAGSEAAHAAATMGARTLLITMNLDTIGQMSCNPSIGGIGKGHMVREIDALGGIMGKVIDSTGIQFRMLNTKKGPAVQAPRAQADKVLYRAHMKWLLEKTPNLELKQGIAEEIVVEEGKISGLRTRDGVFYPARSVIITAGTFLRGLVHIGDVHFPSGRGGEPEAAALSVSLEKEGIRLGRLKTGTPVRINRRSVDFSLTELQPGDDNVFFSFDPPESTRPEQVPCYICHTTAETKEVILKNIHRSPLYRGKIVGVGPRYCPSIEDKVVRFAGKERHQLFLEPEGLTTEEFYVNGASSSLPYDVQHALIHTIPALRNAEIMRPAYAIEYDYVTSGQIQFSLESKAISGLFFAGQINGTTGYEEAAAQGLLAGINAAQKIRGKEPLILDRSESYIGVMIDDIITKGVDEPYRMFTSRAEHRLLLRHDNADRRLRPYGYDLGLISHEQYKRLLHKEETINRTVEELGKTFRHFEGKSLPLSQLLARPEISYDTLATMYPDCVKPLTPDISSAIELAIKYAGYIAREKAEVAKLAHIEHIKIPADLDFHSICGLRTEAKLRFSSTRPTNLGQASRIPGIAPSDISALMIILEKRSHANT